MFKAFLCLICISVPLAAHAKLYKITDEDGNITYTDMAPSLDAKEHKLERIASIGNPSFNMDKLNMSIPYTDENGSMIVSGSVHGTPMRFIVDTGATLLAIPPQIAKKAGLTKLPFKTITTQTANGAIRVPKVMLNSLTVEKIKASHIEATIQSISPQHPDLGLLGMSFFNRFKMTIDQDKKVIQLEKK